MDKKISCLIYNELMKICKGKEYKPMKEFIYRKFLNKLNNIGDFDDIIDFIDSLDNNDKNIFLKELMKKCEFTKEEFYSNNENKKFFLLNKLYEKDYCYIFLEMRQILFQIRDDVEGEIGIKILEVFLKNTKDVIIKRLQLIKLILKDFNPEQYFYNLNNSFEEIKKDINDLIFIKNSLLIFGKNRFQKEILKIL